MRDEIKVFNMPLPIRGFNDTDNEMSMLPNVAVRLTNFDFNRSGIKTRPGYTVYSSSGLPTTTAIDGIYAFKKSDGNRYLLAVTNGAVYLEGATGVFSSVKTGLTASYPFGFATLANLAIGCNGNDAPVKYNGTNCLNLAVSAPTVAPSTAIGAAGNLTGDYQYKITFVSESGAETNGSPSSTVLTASSDQINLTNIATGTSEVTSRKIYRTKAGDTVFWYLDIINDNTTTTYTDGITDANLGTDTVPTNHDDPPSNAKFPTVFKEFLFVVDPDFPTRVYFSHQSYPEIFFTAEGTGYYLIVGLNDGEYVIGMKPLKGVLYVFKEKSTWPVSGNTPDDLKATPQAITSSIGLYHNTVAYVDIGSGDILVGLSKYGFYAFDGYSYRNLGVQKEMGIDITDFINSLDQNQLQWAYGFNDVKKNQYRCFVREAGMSYNNKELVWDYKQNAVAIYDRKGNNIVEWNNNVLFGSSQGNGKIYQIGGLNDAGSAIEQTVEFPWWSVGADFRCVFDRISIDTTLQGNYSATVNCYIDGGVAAHALSLAGGNPWGSSAWVTDKGKYRAKIPLRVVGTDYVHLKGQSIKFKLTHSTLNQPVELHGLTLYYSQTQEISGQDMETPSTTRTMGMG